MVDDRPELFTTELAKNARHGARYEGFGALAGLGLGSVLAASRNLKGASFLARVIDFTFFGWLGGLVARLWTERSDNQTSALKLDSKLIHLEHENKVLKDTVHKLGGELVVENHAEKLQSERVGDCGCRFR